MIILLLILVPFTTANIFLVNEMKTSIKESKIEEFKTLSKEIGRVIEESIMLSRNGVTSIANDPTISQYPDIEDHQVNYHLDLLMNLTGLYDEVKIITNESLTLSSINYRYPGNLEILESYQLALSGESLITKPKAASEPLRLAMVFLHPVINKSGNVSAAIAGQVSLSYIWEMLENVNIGRNGFVYLMDSERNILAHTDKSLVFTPMYTGEFKKDPASFTITAATGHAVYESEDQQMICGYSTLLSDFFTEKENSWTLVVTQPVKDALAAPIMLQQQMYVLFMLFTLLSFIIIYILYKQFVTPVLNLEKGMEKVGEGDFSTRVHLKTGDELEHLASSFNMMTEQLYNYQNEIRQRTVKVERLAKQKDDFLHMLSHDLKNPLTNILTLLSVIENAVTTDKHKKCVDVIGKSAKSMKNMISETLQLSKLEDVGNERKNEPVNMNKIIASVIDENEALFEKYLFTVHNRVSTDCMVCGDSFLLTEVVRNLMTNAVKYTPANHPQKLIIDSEQKENCLIVSFKDFGVGFSRTVQQSLFHQFEKGSKPRKGMDSTGLGLSISKRIIELHNGKIWAESKGPNEGSTFYIMIPQRNNSCIQQPASAEEIPYTRIVQQVDQIIRTK